MDKIKFLKITYNNSKNKEILKKMSNFNKKGIANYKDFIKGKYDIIAEVDAKIDFENDHERDKLIELTIFLIKDFDSLIKEDKQWIENNYRYEKPHGIRNDNFNKWGVEYDEKIRRLLNNPSKIDNIHIYMFESIAKMAKNKQQISKLVDLIQKKNYQSDIVDDYCETDEVDKLFNFEKTVSISNLRIPKNKIKTVKKLKVIKSDNFNNTVRESNSIIYFTLNPKILKVTFYFKNGKEYYIKRNEIRDYYDEYEKKAWNILFEKYKASDNISNISLPNLRESEIIEYSFGDNSISIRDYDNKINYSEKCFNYLTSQYSYIDSNNPKFKNLLRIVKTMSVKFRGAFALHQLLHPENYEWDSSVENYVEILSEVFSSSKEKKEKIYSDMVTIINHINDDNHVSKKVLEEIFSRKEDKLIDDKFFKDFKNISKLKLITVQSILSDNMYSFRKLSLENRTDKRILIKQYIIGLSITPNIFSVYKYDKNRTLNSSMNEFLYKQYRVIICL